ncbi:OmpA family protein [Geoalkalibacter halelectricus]|uniref:OmpA family protein n=1 Tax=Geoalkalibacter halelectricus TaxID=2847045 RepID=A0ABY5ZLH1_9BACT|nr:OmpA family protein [Geoalkalibacter halelectricus]MDO3379003.1 OmpA family protein [Geoalkalibacter halelectricus]UWZ78817.1 OmpA family protein [Geoalkalibacter halelectricus]
MRPTRSGWLSTSLLLCLLLVAGCGKAPPRIEPLALTKNPSEQIELLDADLVNARLNELHILAPDNFAAASTALNNARQGLDRGAGVAEILNRVAIGRAHLETGSERAKVVRSILAAPLEARTLARKVNAVNFGEDYLAVETRLLQLTRAVENERIDWALRRSTAVTEEFLALELRAIKHNALSEAREMLKEARDLRAASFAPESLARAEQALDDAETTISIDRYDRETIAKKAARADFESRRLLHLTYASRSIRDMHSEQIALWIEALLRLPARQLSDQDWRDLSFPDQAKALVAGIESLQKGQEAQRFQIEAARRQIVSLEDRTREEQAAKELYIWEQRAAKEKLEQERRLQQLFQEVQASFTSDEAEVYKQGNHIVLRLRSIHFPVGQAIIEPANYPLLGKVRRAIQRFGEPAVTIEGHTDSTGSDEINARLSQERAEAVRQFFVANDALAPERVLAVGYGSRRPLALNTTAEGRATNRRIDVIISPQQQNGL